MRMTDLRKRILAALHLMESGKVTLSELYRETRPQPTREFGGKRTGYMASEVHQVIEGEFDPQASDIYPDLSKPEHVHGTSVRRALGALVDAGLVLDGQERARYLHDYSLTEAGRERAKGIVRDAAIHLLRWAFLIKRRR